MLDCMATIYFSIWGFKVEVLYISTIKLNLEEGEIASFQAQELVLKSNQQREKLINKYHVIGENKEVIAEDHYL